MKVVVSLEPMLKLCQLMKVRSEVRTVSCEPWELNDALPWLTFPPEGLAWSDVEAHQKSGQRTSVAFAPRSKWLNLINNNSRALRLSSDRATRSDFFVTFQNWPVSPKLNRGWRAVVVPAFSNGSENSNRASQCEPREITPPTPVPHKATCSLAPFGSNR